MRDREKGYYERPALDESVGAMATLLGIGILLGLGSIVLAGMKTLQGMSLDLLPF